MLNNIVISMLFVSIMNFKIYEDQFFYFIFYLHFLNLIDYD